MMNQEMNEFKSCFSGYFDEFSNALEKHENEFKKLLLLHEAKEAETLCEIKDNFKSEFSKINASLEKISARLERNTEDLIRTKMGLEAEVTAREKENVNLKEYIREIDNSSKARVTLGLTIFTIFLTAVFSVVQFFRGN